MSGKMDCWPVIDRLLVWRWGVGEFFSTTTQPFSCLPSYWKNCIQIIYSCIRRNGRMNSNLDWKKREEGGEEKWRWEKAGALEIWKITILGNGQLDLLSSAVHLARHIILRWWPLISQDEPTARNARLSTWRYDPSVKIPIHSSSLKRTSDGTVCKSSSKLCDARCF